MAAIPPLVSHAPRPRMNSSSSEEGKNGGTVSMWVESTTAGSPHAAKTLKRSPSTGIFSTAPPDASTRSSRYRKRKSPISRSFPVVESMSIRARVRAKMFMGGADHIRPRPPGRSDKIRPHDRNRPAGQAWIGDGGRELAEPRVGDRRAAARGGSRARLQLSGGAPKGGPREAHPRLAGDPPLPVRRHQRRRAQG